MSKRVGAACTGPEPSGPGSQSNVEAGAAAARSFSEDGPAPAPSPRLVIRGETSPSGKSSPRIDGNPRAAFTDWVNVTYPVSATAEPAGQFFEAFSKVTRAAFGGMKERPRGLHGYTRSFEFQHGKTLFAFGAQRGTGFVSISGDGCALVPDWPAFVELFRDRLQGRLTRWDGAADDYEGTHSVDDAVALYQAGAFNSSGRKPSHSVDGDWIDPKGSGRTFYVGKRKNGKLLRVYEKGKQLGDVDSPWVRWEVELHNIDRVIPWEVLLEPGRYLAGSYPALAWVQADACRIETLRRTDGITYDRLIHHGRQTYGPLINTMLEREGGAEQVVARLRRPGVPKRLALTERLRIRGKGSK